MKYIIERTSNYSGEDDPKVEGAVMETLPFHYMEHDKITLGKKKRIPARDEMQDCWTIEINTLEDLHNLIDKYCEIVVSNPDKRGWGFRLPTIEIYDTYRE